VAWLCFLLALENILVNAVAMVAFSDLVGFGSPVQMHEESQISVVVAAVFLFLGVRVWHIWL
jgi:hypothetical protein